MIVEEALECSQTKTAIEQPWSSFKASLIDAQLKSDPHMPPFELREDVAEMLSLTNIPVNDDSMLNKSLLNSP